VVDQGNTIRDAFYTSEMTRLIKGIHLNIHDTCRVFQDHYRLNDQVWPAQLGINLHSLIASDLWVLCKGTEAEYHEAALSIREKLASYPVHLSYLDGYINEPGTFAAYERTKVVCSLFKAASTHAEQNHSSIIVARFF
jgi:hypothetical protein